jgi:hypothetical protein
MVVRVAPHSILLLAGRLVEEVLVHPLEMAAEEGNTSFAIIADTAILVLEGVAGVEMAVTYINAAHSMSMPQREAAVLIMMVGLALPLPHKAT